jgi:Ca-activated chloride channel family protein
VIDELIRLSKKYGIMTPYTSFLADETTRLHRPSEVRQAAVRGLNKLSVSTDGFEGQSGAGMRRSLNEALKVAPTSTPGGKYADSSGRMRKAKGVKQYGNDGKKNYEDGKADYVTGLRQAGNTSLYRRGRVWIASSASKLDPAKDKDKIKRVKRFSDEYFDLIRQNSVAENQVMATQQVNEEILLVLRGQAYQIE